MMHKDFLCGLQGLMVQENNELVIAATGLNLWLRKASTHVLNFVEARG
jgi:hypothetical protein